MTDLLWAIAPEFWQRLAGPTPSARASTIDLVPGRTGKSVAVLKLLGVMSKAGWYGASTTQFRADLRKAAADPNVSGILLAVDSPGGTVAGTADLAADVKAARKQKPVWAHVDDLGASAAYWTASQADAVFANSSTALVGSIGTIATMYDVSAMAEKAGIKPLVFSTGPLKGAGVEGTPITTEQQAYFAGLVADAQTAFDAAVKSGRGLTANQLDAVKSGGVFPATEALRLKLIDGIRPLEATLSELAKAK